MVRDTKRTKTVGEHWAASELARWGWAPAMTRDGIERTDILAVHAVGERTQIEVQVKTANGAGLRTRWRLNEKTQQPPASRPRMVRACPRRPRHDEAGARVHRATSTPQRGAWIRHQDWLTEPGVPAGKRNADHTQTYVPAKVFERYEARWDLMELRTTEVPVMLPHRFRELAQDPRVGLPEEHPWHPENDGLPKWTS